MFTLVKVVFISTDIDFIYACLFLLTHFVLSPLSPEEVKMKEDLCAWYQGLGYKEGFGPGEVPIPDDRRSRLISMHPVMSRGKKTLGGDGYLRLLLF